MENLIWSLVGLGVILVTRRQMKPGYSKRRMLTDLAFTCLLLIAGALIVWAISGGAK
jgi:hypothetical protein